MRTRLLFVTLTLAAAVFGCSSSGSSSSGASNGPKPSTPSGSNDPGASAAAPIADDAAHPVHAVASDTHAAVYAVAIDGDRVYFTTDSAVMSAPLAGGTATQVVVASPVVTPALAFDAKSVFWADRGAGDNASTIRLAGKAGGEATVLGAPLPSASAPLAITVDDKNVYYATVDGTIRSLPKGGGAETVIASGQDHPSAIAVDNEAVYWSTGDGAIRKVYLGDKIVNGIAYGDGAVAGITVDDTCIYFSDVKAGAIKMTWKDGSHPQIVADGLTSPSAIVEDEAGKAVYFLVEGALMKVSEDGGSAVRVAHGIDGGTGLAVVQGKGTVVWGSKTGVYATTSP